MSKNLSAIKKSNVSLRNRAHNRIYKANIKSVTKKYLLSLSSINEVNKKEILSNISSVYRMLDKATKRGVIHKNYAARKKSILMQTMKSKLSTV